MATAAATMDPIAHFDTWLAAAATAGEAEGGTAMTLATVGSDGRPAARIVLLKGVDSAGFRFFTNRQSRKGDELSARPFAALCFHWPLLARQVRVEGAVELLPDAESDAYFGSRPRGSQLGAWASQQSQPLVARAELEARLAEFTARFAGIAVQRPPFWGGYLLIPERLEFWTGRTDRLHDRLVYARAASGWQSENLQP
jgi:pyridoxamine 5'-phosphate oxidase